MIASLPRRAGVCACLLLALATAACSKPDADVHVSVIDHISLSGDRLLLSGDSGHRLQIDADGALSLDGKAIALDAAQRAISQRYYQHAFAISRDGVEIGKSGAALAGNAVSAALDGLRNGNPDDIGKKVEAQADDLKAKALKLCGRVMDLRVAQNELAAALPAFQPFAKIDVVSAADCSG